MCKHYIIPTPGTWIIQMGHQIGYPANGQEDMLNGPSKQDTQMDDLGQV